MLEPTIDRYRGLLVVSVSSLLIMLVLRPLLENAISASRSVCSLWWAAASWLLAHDDSVVVVVDDHEDDVDPRSGGVDDIAGTSPPPRGSRRHCCERCSRRGTSLSDVAAVVASLGLVCDADDDEDLFGGTETDDQASCGGCAAMAVVDELTEGKVASEAELREAFYVFDRDEDGFVTAAELWNVMRRLGVPEGARYEDCARMVDAHDGDGDGKVSFKEFRAMMENAA